VARRALVPPDPPLTDGEITLRTRREDDVPSIADASHDPETRRWLDDEPLTADRQRNSVARAEEGWRTGKSAPFVIADAATDAPVGILSVHFGDDDEVAELAVAVFPDARGRGVASRALRLAAIWGLRELGLQRVFAETDAENVASARAIERAGFQREGLLRAHCKTHGRRHDCIMFSVVREDIGDLAGPDPRQPRQRRRAQ
jgi:RimJ/RimL family protein N-acetyltransferase